MKKKSIFSAIAILLLIAVGLGLVSLGYSRWHHIQLNAALQKAVDADDATWAQQLLDQGADVDAIIPEGLTALMRACQSGRENAARALIQHGADVRFQGVVGASPLYLAAEYGFPNIVKMLLDKGADPNANTHSGHTVLDVAESARRVKSRSSNQLRPPTLAQFDEIIQLLHQAGAKRGKRR